MTRGIRLEVDNSHRMPISRGSDKGEPPGGDMLEQRVIHLENDMREVKSDLKLLRQDVAEMKGKLAMLPGWPGLLLVAGFIVTAVGVMIRFVPVAN